MWKRCNENGIILFIMGILCPAVKRRLKDMENNNKFIVLGCRGSAPVCKKTHIEYGGETSSFLLRAGDKAIIFDGGSGILKSTDMLDEEEACHLLLSHMHMDHITGLAFWRPLFRNEKRVHIYSEKRNGMTTKEQISDFLKAPYWPVGVELFEGVAGYHDIDVGKTFEADGVVIKTKRSNHPNECTLFRVEWDGKSVVYALDFEHSEKATEDLVDFAKDCDLLVYDATYTPEDYPSKKGWGHSTWEEGLKVKEKANAKILLLAHLDIRHSDEMLDALQKKLTEIDENVYLAKEGMEISI